MRFWLTWEARHWRTSGAPSVFLFAAGCLLAMLIVDVVRLVWR